MILQDDAGNRFIAVRKFEESRLPVPAEDEHQPSLAQMYVHGDQRLVPAGNGKFRIVGTNAVLTVVRN